MNTGWADVRGGKREWPVNAISCEQVIPEKKLRAFIDVFQCPYCGMQWERGGKKEGFVKAGAFRHVAGCRNVLLFERGYVPGMWVEGRQLAVPLAEASAKSIQCIRATQRSRIKTGFAPTSPGQTN